MTSYEFEDVYQWMNDFIENGIDKERIVESGAITCCYVGMYEGFLFSADEPLSKMEFRRVLKKHYNFTYHRPNDERNEPHLKLTLKHYMQYFAKKHLTDINKMIKDKNNDLITKN